MSAQVKVARLLGAVLIALALVPWLGISPAAAAGGGSSKGSSAAQGHDNNKADKAANADKAVNDDEAAKDDTADKAPDKVKSKANGHAGKKRAEKAEVKADRKADQRAATSSSSSSNQKVTLCHRTNSETNPYVRITVSISSVIKSSGHDGHNGPVYAAGMKAAHQKWGDIIPAFSYDGGSYPGKNWTAGAAIHGAGCAVESGGGHSTPPTTITVTATPSGDDTSQKVTLCHRTNSETNPYVRITVSISSVITSSGHDGHNGAIFSEGMKAAHQKWGDIIPSFTYPSSSGGTTSYGGKNWPAGQAIFDAGCGVSQPTSTTSVSPSGTHTASTPGTSVLPTKIGTDDTGVLGGRTGVLPRTGLDLPLGVALGLSFLLLLAGGGLIAVPSRVNTERNRRH
jgi:hypothetical protein